MGYEEWQIEEACKETDNLTSAIDYLSNNSSHHSEFPSESETVVADPQLIEQMVGMGLDRELAESALIHHVLSLSFSILYN